MSVAEKPVDARAVRPWLLTLRRASLDLLGCAGAGAPLALVWPAYAPLIVLAGFVLGVTVVAPVEPAENYRHYGQVVRLLGLAGMSVALLASLVLPGRGAAAAVAIFSAATTPTVVRGVVAASLLVAALVGVAEYVSGRTRS